MGKPVIAPDLAARLADAWDRGPQVFRDVLAAPVFTPREYMEGVLGTAGDFYVDPQTRYGRIFVAGQVAKPAQLPAFLPSSASDDIGGYLAALTAAHPDFAVILSACERHMPSIRELFVPLLHGLFSRVGYPVQTNLACIYSGSYTTSPFGIHTDPCHVLMCCGIGRKTMAFWPRAYFEPMRELLSDNKVRARVDEHLSQATVLEIGPRDLLYWPANTWHVGISETGDFHASLSLGIYHRASNAGLFSSLDFMPKRTGDLLQIEQYDHFDLHGFGPSLQSRGTLEADALHTSPLAGFFELWRRVRDELTRPDEAEFRMLQLVLSLLTSAGFGPPRVPSPLIVSSLDETTLRCPVPEALLVARSRDGLLIGANGQVFLCREQTDTVARTLARLREGEPIASADLLIDAGPAQETLDVVLRDLLGAGALALVAPAALTVDADGDLLLAPPAIPERSTP